MLSSVPQKYSRCVRQSRLDQLIQGNHLRIIAHCCRFDGDARRLDLDRMPPCQPSIKRRRRKVIVKDGWELRVGHPQGIRRLGSGTASWGGGRPGSELAIRQPSPLYLPVPRLADRLVEVQGVQPRLNPLPNDFTAISGHRGGVGADGRASERPTCVGAEYGSVWLRGHSKETKDS